MILSLSVMVNCGRLQLRTIHERDLLSFLRRCDERRVHLISDKLQLRMKEVPFIGHLATGEGLQTDPSKVQVIRKMVRHYQTGKRGGGTAIYVHNSIPYKHRPDLSAENIESSWVQVNRLKCKKLHRKYWTIPNLGQTWEIIIPNCHSLHAVSYMCAYVLACFVRLAH